MSKLSIQIKYSMIFLLSLAMVIAGLFLGFEQIKTQQLKNEAQAVANQVVAFRSWVARTGVVWVDQLSGDFHDFLGKRLDGEGEMMFSKNPALATRELSVIVEKSSTRASFRVTSDEYRNPLNAPDSFENETIVAFKADLELPFMEAMDNGRYRYAQPIYVKAACLRCHGDPQDAPKEVIEKYGDKRAFGYKVGDVRGIISVNLPDIPLKDIFTKMANPTTLGLILGAFLVSFIFTQHSLIRRLKQLSESTNAIAKGQMEVPLVFHNESQDEIDQVTSAVERLRRSLKIAMKHIDG